MPHIYSENIHRVSRSRKLIPATVSLIFLLICTLSFSVTNKSNSAGFLDRHSDPANAQQVEITISGYVKNQFGAGVGGATATLTGCQPRFLQNSANFAATSCIQGSP